MIGKILSRGLLREEKMEKNKKAEILKLKKRTLLVLLEELKSVSYPRVYLESVLHTILEVVKSL